MHKLKIFLTTLNFRIIRESHNLKPHKRRTKCIAYSLICYNSVLCYGYFDNYNYTTNILLMCLICHPNPSNLWIYLLIKLIVNLKCIILRPYFSLIAEFLLKKGQSTLKCIIMNLFFLNC